MRSGWIALGFVVVAGCSRSTPTRNADVTTPLTSDASREPRASTSTSAKPSPPTAAQRAAFQRALDAGRVATQKKDYVTAIRAFDEALAVLPNHPRVLAERGYARLLANDLDGAAGDFQRAQAVERDATLDAQIWFNLGLVREKRGDTDGARRAFERSNVLHPTKAARAKMGATSACQAQITERAPMDEGQWSPMVARVASWNELYDTFAATLGKDPSATFATEDAARDALCGARDCSGDGTSSWSLSRYFAQNTFNQEITKEPKGLFVIHSGVIQHVIYGTPCGAGDSVAWEVERQGNVVETVGRYASTDNACEERRMHQDPADADCADCPLTDRHETRSYWDVASATHLVSITQRYAPSMRHPPVTGTLNGTTLAIAGGNCDRTIDLTALTKRPITKPDAGAKK